MTRMPSNDTVPLVIPRIMPSFSINQDPFLQLPPEFMQGIPGINMLNNQNNNSLSYSLGGGKLPMLSPNLNSLGLGMHDNSMHHESLHHEINGHSLGDDDGIDNDLDDDIDDDIDDD